MQIKHRHDNPTSIALFTASIREKKSSQISPVLQIYSQKTTFFNKYAVQKNQFPLKKFLKLIGRISRTFSPDTILTDFEIQNFN